MMIKGNINLNFDRESGDYFIAWEPVVFGQGETERLALEDLRSSAHFYVDSLIDLKLKDVTARKEN